MKKTAGLCALVLMFLSACAPRARPPSDIVRQTCARDAVAAWAITNLLAEGDFGIARQGGVNLVIDTGRVYRVNARGLVDSSAVTGSVDFGIVTFFETDRSYDVADMNAALFRQTLDWKRPAPGHIYAIRVAGLFKRMDITGTSAAENASGTMIGFYYPDYLRGVHAGGYEFVFVGADGRSGGSVADFEIAQARIDLDDCNELRVGLPEKF